MERIASTMIQLILDTIKSFDKDHNNNNNVKEVSMDSIVTGYIKYCTDTNSSIDSYENLKYYMNEHKLGTPTHRLYQDVLENVLRDRAAVEQLNIMDKIDIY